MTVAVAILGASGFVGAELLRLCAGHPELVAVAAVRRQPGRRRARRRAPASRPGLSRRDGRALRGRARSTASTWSSPPFPHGQSQAIAPEIIARGIPFVDLGADFRLRRRRRPTSTGIRSRIEAPDLLGRFVYGIPELHRDAIAGARSGRRRRLLPDRGDPGAEAAACGLIDPDTIIVDAASGVSGAGKGLKEETALQHASTRISPPTACSTIATPPRWRWRLAAASCSRRISRR